MLGLLLLVVGLYKGYPRTQTEIMTTPIAAIAQLSGFGVSDTGRVLSRVTSNELPFIDANAPILFGGEQLKGNGIETTLAFLSALKQHNIEVTYINLYDAQYMDLLLASKVVIVYNNSIEPIAMASSLQNMLGLFTIEGRMPTTIDIRYRQPVVVF